MSLLPITEATESLTYLAAPKKITAVLIRSAIVAGLGGLLFGFDTAVIAGATHQLSLVFSLNPQWLGFTVSSALIGTIVGAWYAGYAGDRWGRRDSLRMMAMLYLISALGCGLAWNWSSLLIFRILGGIGIGGSSVLGPMYIAEISPAAWRGRLVGIFQVNIMAGILVAYLSNYVVSMLHLDGTEWRWQLGIPAIPSLIFLLFLFTIPRSPRWLVKKNRIQEAREVLLKIGDPAVEIELAHIVRSVALDLGRVKARLFSAHNRKPIFLAMSIAAFSQFSGINVVLYYLNDIFAAAGFSSLSAGRQAVIIGLTNMVFTVLAMALIDKVGRRVLLLIGSVGMMGTLSGIAAIFATHKHRELLLWILVGYIASFAFSLGAVTWVYISEVFPNAVRSRGQSLGSITHWVINAIIVGVFPTLAARTRALPFAFFAVMMMVLFFVVATIYPETKHSSIDDV